MERVRAFPIEYKKPTCSEDEMYLTFYKKMIEQINKIEEKINKCKEECVLKVDCKETRSNDKAYFKEFFDDILKEIAEFKLEFKEVVKEINNLKIWRYYMSGAMAVIVFLVPFIIGYFLTHEESDSKQFQELKQKESSVK